MVADFRLRGDDDGIAAVRSVRALYPELPAILLSGDTAPDRLREAEDGRHRALAQAGRRSPTLAQAIADAREPARGVTDHERRVHKTPKASAAAPTAWISHGFEELVASRDPRAEPRITSIATS